MTKNYMHIGVHVRAALINIVIMKVCKSQISILDRKEYPLENIPQALVEIKRSTSQNLSCHLALPHRFVMIKSLQFLEDLSERELGQLFIANSEKYFSQPSEMICFDFEYMCRHRKKVQVIASKKDYVARWRAWFRQADLALTTMTSEVLALERFLNYLKMLHDEKIYGIFLINGGELIQVIVMNRHVYFANSITLVDTSLPSLVEEIKKYFRFYESSKIFISPITDIICFGPCQLTSQDLKISLATKIVCYDVLPDSFQQTLRVSDLIPLGVML